MNDGHGYRFDTLCVHAGQEPDPTTGACAVPIYQTAAYVFRDTEYAADLFAGRTTGNIYTRIMNPTVSAFEARMAALEGGAGAVATASGQAAVLLALTNIAQTGDNIVSSASLYGGTYTLFSTTIKRFGIDTSFVDHRDLGALGTAINSRTRAVYIETMGNPRLDVPDLTSVASIAHRAGVPVIIDNTFASPYLCRPIEHGVDIVVHSATKFIGGHGNSIGGIIIDGGNFDWSSGRFPEMTGAASGQNWVESFGREAFCQKARAHMLRDTGPCLSPFNAWLFLMGLETLSLRVERQSRNALAIAEHLARHPRVSWVSYPGLESHDSHKNALRYLSGGFGAMLAFGVRGGKEAGRNLMERLKVFSLVANLGDSRSLVIHPATTTHQQLTPEQQFSSGVTEDLVRMSVGTEDVRDLIDDLDRALGA